MSMGNAGQYTVTARNAVGTVASASAAVGMFSMSFDQWNALTWPSPRLRQPLPDRLLGLAGSRRELADHDQLHHDGLNEPDE